MSILRANIDDFFDVNPNQDFDGIQGSEEENAFELVDAIKAKMAILDHQHSL